jgi:hypothetical protein
LVDRGAQRQVSADPLVQVEFECVDGLTAELQRGSIRLKSGEVFEGVWGAMRNAIERLGRGIGSSLPDERQARAQGRFGFLVTIDLNPSVAASAFKQAPFILAIQAYPIAGAGDVDIQGGVRRTICDWSVL